MMTGGGTENLSFYPGCTLEQLDIVNIHKVRCLCGVGGLSSRADLCILHRSVMPLMGYKLVALKLVDLTVERLL